MNKSMETDYNVVEILGKVLNKMISINSKFCDNQPITKFQSSYVPDVSVESYLVRIQKYAKCSDSCFVVALVYIDRIIESNRLVLTDLNVHRILITSILLSAKFLDDFFYNNAYYAKLGGISTQEMNTLELEFLQYLGFSLQVTTKLYSTYLYELKKYFEVQPSDKCPAGIVQNQQYNTHHSPNSKAYTVANMMEHSSHIPLHKPPLNPVVFGGMEVGISQFANASPPLIITDKATPYTYHQQSLHAQQLQYQQLQQQQLQQYHTQFRQSFWNQGEMQASEKSMMPHLASSHYDNCRQLFQPNLNQQLLQHTIYNAESHSKLMEHRHLSIDPRLMPQQLQQQQPPQSLSQQPLQPLQHQQQTYFSDQRIFERNGVCTGIINNIQVPVQNFCHYPYKYNKSNNNNPIMSNNCTSTSHTSMPPYHCQNQQKFTNLQSSLASKQINAYMDASSVKPRVTNDSLRTITPPYVNVSPSYLHNNTANNLIQNENNNINYKTTHGFHYSNPNTNSSSLSSLNTNLNSSYHEDINRHDSTVGVIDSLFPASNYFKNEHVVIPMGGDHSWELRNQAMNNFDTNIRYQYF